MKHATQRAGMAVCSAAVTAAVLLPGGAWSCATCGCTVNSDAAMGYSAATGWRVNLEYTYIDQSELRSGTGSAAAAAVVDNPSNPSLGGGRNREANHQPLRHAGRELTARTPNGISTCSCLMCCATTPRMATQLQPYTPAETMRRSGERRARLESRRREAHRQLSGVPADPQSGRAARREGAHGPITVPPSISTAGPTPARRSMPACRPAPAAPM